MMAIYTTYHYSLFQGPDLTAIAAFLPASLILTITDEGTAGSYDVVLVSAGNPDVLRSFPGPSTSIEVSNLQTSTTYKVTVAKCKGTSASKVCSKPSNSREAKTPPMSKLYLI